MTPTLDSLLVACRADPDDDLPRLVLADWLDEHAGSVTCSSMQDPNAHNGCVDGQREYRDVHGRIHNRRCKLCSGSGRVSNGNAARAELIRVQIELARLERNCPGPGLCRFSSCRWCALRRREQELIKANGRKWVVFRDGGNSWSRHGMGFYSGKGMEQTFRRGLLHIKAPLQTLRWCLPRLGRELLWCQSVRVTDREPWAHSAGVRFGWYKRIHPEHCSDRDDLPVVVWDRLKSGRLMDADEETFKLYSAREAALADLEQNGDLDGWILEEAWTATQLSQPQR